MFRKPTFQEWAITWMENYKKGNIVEKAYSDYLSILRVRAFPFIGGVRIHKIKQIDIVQLLNEMTHLTHAHIKKTYLIIRQALEAAKQNGYIKVNPADGVVVPNGRTTVPRRSLTEKERKDFLALAETHRYGMWIKVLLL